MATKEAMRLTFNAAQANPHGIGNCEEKETTVLNYMPPSYWPSLSCASGTKKEK